MDEKTTQVDADLLQKGIEEHQRAMAEFFPQEPLLPELVPFLQHREELGWPTLHHPYCVVLFATPFEYGRINRQYRETRDAIADHKRNRKWESFVFRHERPYRVDALRIAKRYLRGDADRWGKLCASVWIDSENIAQYLPFWRAEFRRDGRYWMNDEDRIAFAALPERIEIWRGECNDGGFSWTLSEQTARWFAKRQVNESTGEVSHGWVAKSDVFAHLIGRGESEILVRDRSVIEEA